VKRCFCTLPKRRFSFIQLTSHPTIYTTDDMVDDCNLSAFGKQAKELFGAASTGKFIPPNEMNYRLPANGVPEFAFVGRSNVGKSSLIDNLLGGRKIVRVSKEPGCTRSVNFYGISKGISVGTTKDFSAYLVDLPGYGYAKTSKRDQQKWLDTLTGYLTCRDQSILRRVYLLVDSRRGIQMADEDMMQLLNDSFIPYQILFTKVDLVKSAQLQESLRKALHLITVSNHGTACLPFIHTISSSKQIGINTLKLSIGEVYSHKWN